MKTLAIIMAAIALSGCVSVGDHVGGPDRCVSVAYGACTMKVVNGVVEPGSTIDIYSDGTILVDADVRASGVRHAFDAARYNGTLFEGNDRPDQPLN